jgi:peptide/nickel transport system permease protein
MAVSVELVQVGSGEAASSVSWSMFIWRFRRNLKAIIGSIVLLGVILMAIFAGLISPYDPYQQDLSITMQGPSSAHWMGTDRVGRDVLARVIFGSRTALWSSLLVVLISELIGVPLGIIAGFRGGWLDDLIMRSWDMLLAFPPLLLAFVIVAVFGQGLTNAVIALGILYIPSISRLVRSVTLVEREQTYVEAARAMGYGNMRIVFRHILPNCVSPIIVQSTLDFAYALLDIAALSFLGLGVQPPTADWGSMLSSGRDALLIAPSMSVFPGLAIVVAVLSFNLLGDGLRDILDPRTAES